MWYVWEIQRWFRSLHNNLIQLGSNALFSDLTLKMRKFIWPVIFTGWFCSVFSPTRKIKWDWSFELRHDLPIPLLSWKQKKEPVYYRTLFKIQSPSRTNSTIVYCSLHTYMNACMLCVCVWSVRLSMDSNDRLLVGMFTRLSLTVCADVRGFARCSFCIS